MSVPAGGEDEGQEDAARPISSVLRDVLAGRRHDPAGEPLPPAAYVFGDALGRRAKNIREAWAKAVLKAHGLVPVTDKETGRLTAACRQQYQSIDLHFHDLRREAGSRWMDAGVPLSVIQKWLGHANIAQTSTYLAATGGGDADAMKRFEQKAGRMPVTRGDAFSGSNASQPGSTTTATIENIQLNAIDDGPKGVVH